MKNASMSLTFPMGYPSGYFGLDASMELKRCKLTLRIGEKRPYKLDESDGGREGENVSGRNESKKIAITSNRK